MDFSEFKHRFIEDVSDTISNLEKDLLLLEKDPGNKELINSVFRVMHSLKGVSGMYGYHSIGEYTHLLETLYDKVRDDEIKLSAEILNLTFSSIDHISNLLRDVDMLNVTLKSNHKKYIHSITKLIDSYEFASNKIETIVKDNNEINFGTYFIDFEPSTDLFKRGLNVLSVFEELQELGLCIVKSNITDIPTYEFLVADDFYISWSILISTNQPLNSIEDVLIFYEDSYSITFLSPTVFEPQTILNEKLIRYFETSPIIDKTDLIGIIQNETITTENTIEKIIQKDIRSIEDQKITSIRVQVEKLDELRNLASELVTTQAELSLLAEKSDNPEIQNLSEKFEKISRKLRDNALSVSLLPIKESISKFSRLIRDLSVELNKEVDFVAEGTDTELDKTIIENISSPLMHIFRNSMDHGIETREQRLKKGKSPKGTLKFKAMYSGALVELCISDDGAGIDPQKIKNKAIEKGLCDETTVHTDKEWLDFIFLPGFSTASHITGVSGRGVGMDVVKRKISDMNGTIEMESKIDAGTKITIRLPLTLSIIDALLTRVSNSMYIFPLSNVDFCHETTYEELNNYSNKRIVIENELIPFITLRSEFDFTEKSPEYARVVTSKYNDKRIGIVVDEVIGEYQAVIKPIGELFKNQDFISGASIMGDGNVALVLDTNKLIVKLAH